MDQDPLKGLREHPQDYFIQQKAGNNLERTMPKFPNIVYKCLDTFKGGYAIDLHWYESWFVDTNLRSILLYVYFCS